MAEWISVNDRLPWNNERCIVFTGSISLIATYLGKNRWRADYYGYERTLIDAFTHWMPLPEPPKEDE